MKPWVSTGSSIKSGPCFNCIFKNVWYFFFSPSGGSEVLECKCFPLLCVIFCVLIFHVDSLLLVILVMMSTWPWLTHAYWTTAVHSPHCGIFVWHFWLLNDQSGRQRCHNLNSSTVLFMQFILRDVLYNGTLWCCYTGKMLRTVYSIMIV